MITKFQVVKQTLADNSEVYQIKGLSDAGIWVKITTRHCLDSAKVAVEQLRNKAVVKEEVLDV